MEHIVKILEKEIVTHDVKRFVIEKPEGYSFEPGQVTLISINKPGWEKKKRAFTFESLPEDLVLEFLIKEYPERKGVTSELHKLEPGDELILGNVFGVMRYHDEGVFIAGGAGITPFLSMLKKLHKEGKLGNNKLFFSNKKQEDIILEKELKDMFKEHPDNLVFTLTREEKEGYESGRINKEFLQKHLDNFNQNFYIVGPPPFISDIKEALASLGANTQEIVLES
jgi:ferredoxin-NADP reductase